MFELPIWTYPVAILAGILAGIVNTMAGSGSLVTLPMLVFLGLPTSVANGTNRVGVTFQAMVGLATLRSRGALQLRSAGWFVVPIVLGAVAGAQVAAEIDERALNLAIAAIMVGTLIALLLRPQQFLAKAEAHDGARPKWWLLLAFVGIGLFGGFIQAGVGILLLVGLVMGAKLEPMHATGVKLSLTLLFTSSALAVFVWHGQVDWVLGGIVAVGQGLGAWLAARFLAGNERAGLWIRRALIAVVAVSSVKFLVEGLGR